MGSDSLAIQLFRDIYLTPPDTSALMLAPVPTGSPDYAALAWIIVGVIFVVGVAAGYFLRVAVD